MSTLYQSSKDVPTEVLSARLNQLSDVVSSNRERIDAEFTMRIPAEVDRDADLVMSEAAVRLEALQAECERWKNAAHGAHRQLTANRLETEKLAVDWGKAMAECEKLRKDAKQYRRLIELGKDFQWENIIRVDISDFPSRADAIDSAMREK